MMDEETRKSWDKSKNRMPESMNVIRTRSTCKVCEKVVGFKNTRMVYGYMPTDHTHARNRMPIWFYVCCTCFKKCREFRGIVNADDAKDWYEYQ